jgi:hypothetical protein
MGTTGAMDLDSAVIFGSVFFAAMVPDASVGGSGGRRVEVDGVDNLEAFEDRLNKLLRSRSDASLSFPFPSGFFCLFVLFDS